MYYMNILHPQAQRVCVWFHVYALARVCVRVTCTCTVYTLASLVRRMSHVLCVKESWLVIVFMLILLAGGVLLTCLRLKAGDEVGAATFAVISCGLIMGIGMYSLIKHRGIGVLSPKKRKIVTVSLKAHYMQREDVYSDPMCSICLVDLEVGNRIVQLENCSHAFHAECISEWVTRKAQCPACRSDMPTVVTCQGIAV